MDDVAVAQIDALAEAPRPADERAVGAPQILRFSRRAADGTTEAGHVRPETLATLTQTPQPGSRPRGFVSAGSFYGARRR